MERKLSDVLRELSREATIIRDCQFDDLYLVGKPYPEDKKTISFLGAPKFISDFLSYDINGVLCTKEIADEVAAVYQGGIAVVDEPKTVFFEIHNYLVSIESNAKPNVIAESAIIHPSVIIEDHDVVIGDCTEIMANAVVKSGSRIGCNCIIREGCVVGSPAFYYYGSNSNKKLVTSSGTAVIQNNVELHTNVTVEKGVMGGATIIGENTKIDNTSLIGHDSVIGHNVTIAASATLAGGVRIGNNSFLGVGVTIAPYVNCGERVKLSAGSVVTKDVPDDLHESGNFAIPHDKYLKHIKAISK